MNPTVVWADRLPGTVALEAMLNQDLPGVRVVGRQINGHTSTSPSEIVSCVFAGGQQHRLFCKYFFPEIVAAELRTPDPFYELRVYRAVLRGCRQVPRVYCTYINEVVGEGFLAVEYLADASRLNKSVNWYQEMIAATQWIGDFHTAAVHRLGDPELAFLRMLNRDYFETHLRTSLRVLEDTTGAPRWLKDLADAFDEWWMLTSSMTTTIVHAEFYPKNILARKGRVYPVDWETASVGPAEFDLAMLLSNWGDEMVEPCLETYMAARAEVSEMREQRRRLQLADLLVNIHWVGIALALPTSPKGAAGWLGRLRQSAAAIGVAS